MTMHSSLIVIALGGNAIQQPGQAGTFEEQLFNVDAAARGIASLITSDCQVVVTHGNGPQVGNLLIQNELGSEVVAQMPMDVCGAETQGQIGYMLQQCLTNHLRRQRKAVPVVTLVSETEVDASDGAFSAPTKPVGPFYDATRAKHLEVEKGFVMREDAGRGWRRVVPSPVPVAHLQASVIARLVAAGVLVVCCGGGGIPVIRGASGDYRGVEAVIDKDRSAAVLAASIGADTLIILTDVPEACLDYGTDRQRALGRVDCSEMQEHLEAGQFNSGSMGPKVEAAIQFANGGGSRAVIAGLHELRSAVKGTSGTQILGSSGCAAVVPKRVSGAH